MLISAAGRSGFLVLEQPIDTKKFIGKTIADYKAFVQEENARMAEEKRQREEAALRRKFKKELKDQKSKEKMLQKLVAELGPDAVQSVLAVK